MLLSACPYQCIQTFVRLFHTFHTAGPRHSTMGSDKRKQSKTDLKSSVFSSTLKYI